MTQSESENIGNKTVGVAGVSCTAPGFSQTQSATGSYAGEKEQLCFLGQKQRYIAFLTAATQLFCLTP